MDDEEMVIKTLIIDSVPEVLYLNLESDSAQEYIHSCLKIGNMKPGVQTLKNLILEFNLDKNKSKIEIMHEWNSLKLKHQFQNVTINETDILNRFIDYVASWKSEIELKNQLTEIHKCDSSKVWKAICVFYEWKIRMAKYEPDFEHSSTTVINSNDVINLDKKCYLCKSSGHLKINCPMKDCCFMCGDPNHFIIACPVNRKRLLNKYAIKNRTHCSPHDMYMDRLNYGCYNNNNNTYYRGNFRGRDNRGGFNNNFRGIFHGNVRKNGCFNRGRSYANFGRRGGYNRSLSKNRGGRLN